MKKRPISTWPNALAGSPSPARDAHPQHVHRRADVLHREAGPLAQRRVAAVGGDHEVGVDLDLRAVLARAHAGDAVAFVDEVGRLRLHHQMEAAIALAMRGKELEEVPLRHEGDELAVGRQAREIGERDLGVAEQRVEVIDLVVRQLEELVEQAELAHQLQRRGMDGVAAEIAQEVAVLLQHHDVDAAARQQETEHHPGRPAAGDAALRGDRIVSHGDTARFGEFDAASLALCAISPSSLPPPLERGRVGVGVR